MNDDALRAVSHSLSDLHRLRSSLRVVPSEKFEQIQLLKLAGKLGSVAVPLCIRAISRGDDQIVDWGMQLLLAVATKEQGRNKITSSLRDSLRKSALSDAAKVRLASLLSELGGGATQPFVLKDAEKFRRDSLSELAGRLKMPRQLARAADELVASLEGDEMTSLIGDLADVSPDRAAALMEELLIRDDLDDELRADIRSERTLLRLGSSAEQQPLSVADVWIGRRPHGGMVAIARNSQAKLERVLVVLIAPGCFLLDVHYQDDLSSEEIASNLIDPLGDEGFELHEATLDSVRKLVCRAARRRLTHSLSLPYSFYLGRDLLDIHDEFLPMTRRLSRKRDKGLLFARATELLAEKQYGEALVAMERYVSAAPSDPEGHSGLGVCLLGLERADEAENQFRRAKKLDPSNRQYTWNLAVAAKRAGRVDVYKQSLTQYVATSSACPEIDARTELARELLGEEERFALLDGGNQPRLPGV